MARKNKKSRRRPKEEIAEDFCFICKDGGDLLICEYKQCMKVYHFDCVDKDKSFLTSKEKWVCDRHSCMVCKKKSQVQCYCCPKAACWNCIYIAELVNVQGKFGFCCNCLKLALLIEENMDSDSDGEKVDLKDQETYEGLFREYYKIIQKEEGFSADNVRAAENRLKAGKNILSDLEADESDDEEKDEMISDEGIDNRRGYKLQHKNKRLKKGLPVMRCVQSKRMQFCGWGSTSLIKFLNCIGQDTSQKLSQHDVYFIIRKYIIEKNLPDPTKKKMIICDENLQSIFQKKTVNKNKIFGLLESHFVENIEESEEEEALHDSQCEGKTPLVTCRTRKMSKLEKGSPKRDAICSERHSCYASVSAENIKHVYLRKSLVYELSKQPESFERKVIGSFVRIKSEPHDYFHRNSHQLVQVTGILKSVTCQNKTDIILSVSEIPKEISINLLSDADFTEEECEDLRQRVKDGLVQKPTVAELQEKARSLHVDITKHWIAKELKILNHRKDQANEKGWRREFFEYIERKKLLQTPSEQSRLLENYPIVTPEVADLEPDNKDTNEEINQNHELEVCLEPTIGDTMDESKDDEALPKSIFPIDPNDKSGAEDDEDSAPLFVQGRKEDLSRIATPVSPHNSTSKNKRAESEPSTLQEPILPNDQHEVAAQVDADRCCSHSDSLYQTPHNADVKSKKKEPLAAEVILLDGDSDNESRPNAAVERRILEDPESSVWYISGPDGIQRKKKYSLSLLKRWTEASSYAFKFKVWKENQNQEHAIPLGDAINLAFP